MSETEHKHRFYRHKAKKCDKNQYIPSTHYEPFNPTIHRDVDWRLMQGLETLASDENAMNMYNDKQQEEDEEKIYKLENENKEYEILN